jgi:hypothetical protein
MMKPDVAFREALTTYAMKIRKDGWASGETLIETFEEQFPDFRRWAYACGIMLRAEELLKDGVGA